MYEIAACHSRTNVLQASSKAQASYRAVQAIEQSDEQVVLMLSAWNSYIFYPLCGVFFKWSEVGFHAHHQPWNMRHVMEYLRHPMTPDSLEGMKVIDAEADDKNVSLGIPQRTNVIVIYHTCRRVKVNQ